MDQRDAAQAVELIRALCDALDEMTRHLPWLEHRGAQLEAAALVANFRRSMTSRSSLPSGGQGTVTFRKLPGL